MRPAYISSSCEKVASCLARPSIDKPGGGGPRALILHRAARLSVTAVPSSRSPCCWTRCTQGGVLRHDCALGWPAGSPGAGALHCTGPAAARLRTALALSLALPGGASTPCPSPLTAGAANRGSQSTPRWTTPVHAGVKRWPTKARPVADGRRAKNGGRVKEEVLEERSAAKRGIGQYSRPRTGRGGEPARRRGARGPRVGVGPTWPSI